MTRGQVVFWVLLVAGIVLMAYGGYYIYLRQTLGIVGWAWGLMVVTYVFFALASTGSSIVNTIHTVYGYDGAFGKYIRYTVYVSLATVLPAFPIIISDLGAPENFAWMFLGFNPTSRMAWMGVLYVLFALILLVELIAEIHKKGGRGIGMLTLGLAVVIISVVTHSNLGQIFGSAYGIPGWFGPFMAVLFIASALMIGFALQTIALMLADVINFGQVRPELRELVSRVHIKGMLTMIGVYVFMAFWYHMAAFYSPPMALASQEVLWGRFAGEFWGIEVFLGLVLPLIILPIALKRRSVGLAALAAFLLIVGQFFGKVSLTASGQIGRILFDASLTQKAYYAEHLIADFKSEFFGEAPALAFAVGLWLVLFALGVKLLALEEGEKPKRLLIFR